MNNGLTVDPTYGNVEYFFNQVLHFFDNFKVYSIDTHLASKIQFIFGFAGAFFLAVIIYALVRMLEIWKNEHRHIEHAVAMAATEEKHQSQNPKWQNVLNHINSDNPSDWRMAILEADTILDEVVDGRGYTGDTLGERMQNIPSGDIANFQRLWEAHKVRNRIAHEGTDFKLSQNEAMQTIRVYEDAFRELGAI